MRPGSLPSPEYPSGISDCPRRTVERIVGLNFALRRLHQLHRNSTWLVGCPQEKLRDPTWLLSDGEKNVVGSYKFSIVSDIGVS